MAKPIQELPPAAPPLVFLAGPPGSGKTTLGSQACERLGIAFLDLSAPAPSASDAAAGRRELEVAIAVRAAEVIALSWSLQGDRDVLKLARRSGEVLLLWAHPLEMQARSGHTEPLFTPVARLRTHGGFGRHGTGCGEYRRLERACTASLLFKRDSLEESVVLLREALEELREDASTGTPAEQADIDWWVTKWKQDCNASPKAARILVDAMATYILQLRAEGRSARALSAVYSDLDAAGMLVFMYDAPKGANVLDSFHDVPLEYEYERKFSDAPGQMKRYRQTLGSFARFVRSSGLVPGDEEDGA